MSSNPSGSEVEVAAEACARGARASRAWLLLVSDLRRKARVDAPWDEVWARRGDTGGSLGRPHSTILIHHQAAANSIRSPVPQPAFPIQSSAPPMLL